MSKLREPLRELLRDPISPAQLDAIWRRIEWSSAGRARCAARSCRCWSRRRRW